MKKKLHIILSAALCAVMLLSLTACGGTTTPDTPAPPSENTPAGTPDKVYEWDMLVENSLTHPSSILAQEFATLLEERSEGRIKVTVRAPGELPYTAADYLTAVGDNSAALGDVNSMSFGSLPHASISLLPFLMNSLEDFYTVMDITGSAVEEELESYGCHNLWYFPWPPQSFWSASKPLSSLKDIQGMKIRTSNVELSNLVQTLGGIPVTLAGAEVPSGLSTGVVDGVITAAYGLGGAGWYDTLNYGYITNMQIIPSYMCISKAEYDALPTDLQELVDACGDEFEKYACETMFNQEQEWRDTLISEHNFTINTISDAELAEMAAMMNDYWTTWAEEKGGQCPALLQEIITALDLG